MKLYNNGVPVGEIVNKKRVPWKINYHLAGINITQNKEKIGVEGVYMPSIEFQRFGGYIHIQINLSTDKLILIAFGLFPKPLFFIDTLDVTGVPGDEDKL